MRDTYAGVLDWAVHADGDAPATQKLGPFVICIRSRRKANLDRWGSIEQHAGRCHVAVIRKRKLWSDFPHTLSTSAL